MATSGQQPYPVPLAVGATPAGLPIFFSQGPFAGMTIRTTVTELQKPDGGRKYARKDKRPLDPPPVVQVRFFEVLNRGNPTQQEREILAYDDPLVLGLVCHVCLYTIPEGVTSEGIASHNANDPMAGVVMTPVSNNIFPYGGFLPGTTATQPYSLLTPRIYGSSSTNIGSRYNYTQKHSTFQRQAGSSVSNFTGPSNLTVVLNPPSIHMPPGPNAPASSDILAYYRNYAITKSSNCTQFLAGALVTHAVALEYNSRPTLAFVFNDLAIRKEGSYTLHYQVFNIFANATRDKNVAPVLANCFGGAFKVWSSKNFPGLAPSTDLTKLLAWHTPLTTRYAERKSKKAKTKHPSAPETPATAASTSSHEEASASTRSGNEFSATCGGRTSPARHQSHYGDLVGAPQQFPDASRDESSVRAQTNNGIWVIGDSSVM